MVNFIARKIYKNVYPGTYTFKEDDDGGIPTDWTDESGAGATVVVASDWLLHKKVIKATPQVAGNNAGIFIIISEQESGTIELWMGSDDVSWRTAIHLQEENTTLIQIELDEDEFQRDGATTIVAASDDTWYHVRIDYECGAGGYLGLAADTYFVTINNIQYGAFAFDNAGDGVNRISLQATDSAAYNGYFDAIGDSVNDSDYNIGDNVFWRHLKDQDSDFESEDEGTTSTSIGFVDTDGSGGNAVVEIVAEFNSHKKVLKITANADGSDGLINSTVSGSPTSGTVEWWQKTDNAAQSSQFRLNTGGGVPGPLINITGNQWTYYDGATHNIVAAADDTWYHLKIEFECGGGAFKGLAADTFFLWINNVKYGPFDFWNAIASIGIVQLVVADNVTYSGFYDAFSYSFTTGNAIADNRTFDYHTHTYDDISADLFYPSKISKKPYEKYGKEEDIMYGDKAIIKTKTSIDISILHFIQLYNSSGSLLFEGEVIEKETIANRLLVYRCKSLNKFELQERVSADWTSSGKTVLEMLQILITNLTQTDGRLILDASGDNPSGDFTFGVDNYPRGLLMEQIADLQQRIVEIKPNGVCKLTTGTSIGITINDASGEIAGKPNYIDLEEDANYIVVYGGWNPNTGAPFEGFYDGSGVDDIRKYWDKFDYILSQTECNVMAEAIYNNQNAIRWLNSRLKHFDFHTVFHTITFASTNFGISSDTYFIQEVILEIFSEVGFYKLSTGITPKGKYTKPPYKPQEQAVNDLRRRIYETDIISIEPRGTPEDGATQEGEGIHLDTLGEFGIFWFQTGDKIDTNRVIKIRMAWLQNKAFGGTITIDRNFNSAPLDGSATRVSFYGPTLESLASRAQTRYGSKEWTIAVGDVKANWIYDLIIKDGAAEQDWFIADISVKYFLKRIVE